VGYPRYRVYAIQSDSTTKKSTLVSGWVISVPALVFLQHLSYFPSIIAADVSFRLPLASLIGSSKCNSCWNYIPSIDSHLTDLCTGPLCWKCCSPATDGNCLGLVSFRALTWRRLGRLHDNLEYPYYVQVVGAETPVSNCYLWCEQLLRWLFSHLTICVDVIQLSFLFFLPMGK